MLSNRQPNELMKNSRRTCSMLATALVLFTLLAVDVTGKDQLKGEFQLGRGRSTETQYYEMSTIFDHFALDGKLIESTTCVVWLQITPRSGRSPEEVVCGGFVLKTATSTVSIPALAGWRYQLGADGVDQKGQIFGIDQSKFQELKDSTGRVLSPEQAYIVFNSLVDFHSFCNVFGDRMPDGKGIQDLHKIGDRIVHAAAFSEAPVSLMNTVAEGSTFKNGEITLELKGVSLVDQKPCALVGYDSGISSFQMALQPTSATTMRVKGGSRYSGDLYVDLASQWLRRATMRETVITEVTIPSGKINQVIERQLTLRTLSPDQFRAARQAAK